MTYKMNSKALLTLSFFAYVTMLFGQKEVRVTSGGAKPAMIKNIDAKYDAYKNLALQIWGYAEVGYKEYKSSEVLQTTLKNAGFSVEAGVVGIPTAFVATFGSGSPTIGILAEFDALPGLSQEAISEKKSIATKDAGHACGHHLFGVASVAAAIELKSRMQAEGFSGTIKVYGTPAEEGGSGKVYMVRDGLFDGVDVVLHWHPDDENNANPSSSLANISAKFRFHGVSAHAAGAPDRGRSALDGVESMDYMVNMMREHIPSDARVHYVITNGGRAPNVVPDFAEVYYYARHPEVDVVQSIFQRIVKAAEGAALGTETKMDYEMIGGVYNLLPITSLSKLMYSNLGLVGGVSYSAEEMAFNQNIQSSFDVKKLPAIERANQITPFDEKDRAGMGSTDVGDISWVVPTVGLRAATWTPGTAAHSWQAVACGGTDIGIKGMMVAAKTLALTGYDLFKNQQIIQEATSEFNAKRGKDYKYKCLLGDRKPALNYRD